MINSNLDAYLKTLEDRKRIAIELWGRTVERYAVENETAVDTGALRNSIVWQPLSNHSLIIGSAMKYAHIIEFKGGKGGRGKNFLRRAVTEHTEELKGILVKALKS